MKKYAYVVILKRESQRPVNLLSLLLCLSSAVIFVLTAFSTGIRNYYFYILAALLLAGLLYNAVTRTPTTRLSYRYLLGMAAIGWFAMPAVPWVGLIFVVLAFLEHQTKRPLEIGFDHNRVVINSLIRRRHDWSVFNNVILRDGLLTLDFKNNRLIQREIADDEDEDDADEEEFNAYCRDRLAAAYGK